MKKLISLLLALVMVFTFTVVPAMAEETDGTEEPVTPAGPASVVYFVGDAQEGEAVADLLSGEAYNPDRMPAAETPTGKYFVGWADSTGEIVPNEGITLAEGENKLTAVYKSFAAETDVDLSKHTAGGALTSNIGYIKNGEYLGQVVARTGGAPKAEYITDDETGETYLQVSPNSLTSAGGTGFILVDANGDVIQGKWGTKYQIAVEYRIPENNDTLSLRASFGANISQAPAFRNESGNDVGVVKMGSFWSVTAASGLEGKWHDHGGNFYRFGDTVENAATTDGWKTATFEGTTGAADANYLPVFMLAVGTSTSTATQKFQIKSITVIDTTIENIKPATVEYVVDGETVATVEDFVAGDTYIPDRTPETAAPTGKYFAGWVDAEGDYALINGFTLAAGVNKLYAKYVDYPGRNTSTGVLNYTNEEAFALPSYDSNSENFLNYIDAFGSYLNFTSVELDGETVLRVKNNATWGSRANYIIPNSDGSAMQIVPGHKYEITITYKIPDYKEPVKMLFGSGFGFVDNTGAFKDLRAALNTPFQGIAKDNANLTFTTDTNLSLTPSGWPFIWLSGASHAEWAITGASTEWQTATYTCNTSADFTGFLPILQGALNLPGSSELYIKEITVNDLNWIAPATVVVKANGEVEETFDGYKEGDTFAIDRMPNAETPEGKYFAGWQLNGKFIVDLAVLGAGENVIEAVYKDYASGEITADLKEANLPKTSEGAAKVILPSVVEDVYQNHVLSGGWTNTEDASDDTGEYLRYFTDKEWSSNSLKVLRYTDGSAIIAKPETEYTISVTYRLGKFPETYTASWEDFTNNGGDKANMMMYVMVGFDPTIRNAFENNNGQTGPYGKATPTEHATWYDHGFGLGLWTDVCADGWVTETFKITTKTLEQYEADGYIPAFTLCTGVNNNNFEVHIKDVTVVEHVHDWVADPESDKAPTCVEHGKAAYKCDCGKVKYEELKDELIDHDYSVNDGLTCSMCKDSLVPVAPVAAKVTANSVTLVEFAGLEYSIDGENWQASATFTDLTAETEYTFYQRVAASDIANAGAMSEALVVTTEAAPDFIPGDVDGNGTVNATDLATLKKVIASLTPLDDPSVVYPDVDNSGSATPNAADLAQLKKIIAGLV